MPKITLMNTETGKEESFEPVDAREVLAMENTVYQVPEGTSEQIGMQLSTNTQDVNVPQLQGPDAEMQTGLSIEKYGRSAVVKAQPGLLNTPATGAAARHPQGAMGITPTVQQNQREEDAGEDPNSMTKDQLRAALDEQGVEYPGTATKADLVALYEQNRG